MPVLFTPPTGASGKYEDMRKHVLPWLNKTAGTNLAALLLAMATEDWDIGGTDPTTGGIQAARNSMTLGTATGADLAVIGQNYGIANPTFLGLTDAQFRTYIQLMAFQPKVIKAAIYAMITLMLGPQSTVGWNIYEIRHNVITVDIGNFAIVDGPGNSSYFHDVSYASNAQFPGNYFVDATAERVQFWQPNRGYNQMHYTQPSPANGRYYWATTPGQSGSTQPTFPSSYGSTVVDNGVTWTDQGLITTVTTTPGPISGSTVTNNGIWISDVNSRFPFFQLYLALIRAAGVSVEFKTVSE